MSATALLHWFRKSPHGAAKCSSVDNNASPPGIIKAGDFTIDTARRTATLRGEALLLTPEEFEVLIYLAGHPQRLVTPHTVLSTNWSANQLRQTDFLKVLLSLRKKIDALSEGKHYLRTEPWVVYRFDPDPSSSG